MDGIGSVFGGYSQAGQYKAQEAQAQQQAKDVSIQATQASEQRREQLNASLANISANRVQSNLSIDSPTAQAIEGAVKTGATRTEQIGRLGYLNQEQSLQWQAKAYHKAARNAITGGWIGGLTAVGKDALAGAGY